MLSTPLLSLAIGYGEAGEAVSSATNGKIAFMRHVEGANNEIYVINPDGSGEIDITNNPNQSDIHPDWSPDGSKIAFVSNPRGQADIHVLDVSTGATFSVTADSSIENYPNWSPDGTRLAFSADGFIQVINLDGTGRVRLTEGYDPAWSVTGQIAFTRGYRDEQEIYVMAEDGIGITRLTENSLADSDASWSPDGKKIAFRSERPTPAEIYIMDADGSNLVNLTNNTWGDGQPEWSPDGDFLALLTYDKGCSAIHVIRRDGSQLQRIGKSCATDSELSWGTNTFAAMPAGGGRPDGTTSDPGFVGALGAVLFGLGMVAIASARKGRR